jgi:hypothetical protein
MQALTIGAGIVIVLVAWEANPKLGGALLALVVLLMLTHGASKGYFRGTAGG